MYWKVIMRYGHVGQRNEVSVARYLKFHEGASVIDVINEIQTMPGVKHKSYRSIFQVSREEYMEGKEAEKLNFYLQNLFGKTA